MEYVSRKYAHQYAITKSKKYLIYAYKYPLFLFRYRTFNMHPMSVQSTKHLQRLW